MFFCKHAWYRALHVHGMDKRLAYHPACPNVCARFEGNPCNGKANVIQASNSIIDSTRRSSFADASYGLRICKPAGAGIFDYEYECICRKVCSAVKKQYLLKTLK